MAFAYIRSQVARPLSCHSCKSKNIRLIDATKRNPEIFADWGLMYHCDECHASVTTRKGTSIPLGFMAVRSVRALRQAAHKSFDTAWQAARMARADAYRWLAQQMNMNEKECHIAMFNKHQCRNVIDICSQGIKK